MTRFVDKRYKRSKSAPVLTAPAAARVCLAEKRIVRRRPSQAAVIMAERIMIAQPESVWRNDD